MSSMEFVSMITEEQKRKSAKVIIHHVQGLIFHPNIPTHPTTWLCTRQLVLAAEWFWEYILPPVWRACCQDPHYTMSCFPPDWDGCGWSERVWPDPGHIISSSLPNFLSSFVSGSHLLTRTLLLLLLSPRLLALGINPDPDQGDGLVSDRASDWDENPVLIPQPLPSVWPWASHWLLSASGLWFTWWGK